jgi:25S rRNA (uracil2634-N3)-methyltransferase
MTESRAMDVIHDKMLALVGKAIENLVVSEQTMVIGSQSALRHAGLFNSGQRILLVGEGDLSFARSLATSFGDGSNITATTLDSLSFVLEHYGNGYRNVQALQALGATVLHEVDATRANLKLTDVYVFNFPHPGWLDEPSRNRRGARFGDEKCDRQIRRHRNLLAGFFDNLQRLLPRDSTARVYITTKVLGAVDDSASHRDMWNVPDVGRARGFSLIEERSFSASTYPGYLNKYGTYKRPDYKLCIDESFPMGDAATRVFGLKAQYSDCGIRHFC